LGNEGGTVLNEVRSALLGSSTAVKGYIGGLGGRDVPPATIEKIFLDLLDVKNGKKSKQDSWIDVKENAMEMREVLLHV